jgi:hypothetical protein
MPKRLQRKSLPRWALIPYVWRPIQRFSCCECGYKFSDPKGLEKARKALKDVETVESMELKSQKAIVTSRQIRVNDKETKNLVAEQTSILVPPQKHEKQDQKGAVIEFQFWLKKQQRAKTTYEPYGYNLLYLINNGANNFDPKSVNDLLYQGKLADKKRRQKTQPKKSLRRIHARLRLRRKNRQTQNQPTTPVSTARKPHGPTDCKRRLHNGTIPTNAKRNSSQTRRSTKNPMGRHRLSTKQNQHQLPSQKLRHPKHPCFQKIISILKNLPRNHAAVFPYKNPQTASNIFRRMRKRAIR